MRLTRRCALLQMRQDSLDHVRLSPELIRLRLLLSVTLGCCPISEIATVTDRLILPPGPLQARLNVVDWISAEVASLPFNGRLPNQPPVA